MKNVLKRLLSLWIIGAVSAAMMIPVSATSIRDLQNDIQQQQQHLNEVNENIESIEDEQDILEEEIADLDAGLVNMLTSIGILEDDIATKAEEIIVAQEKYDAAKAVEKEQYDAMKVRIQYMYENGNASYLSIFFESDSMADLLNKAEYVEQIYVYDRKKLEEFEAVTKQVEELRVALENEKEILEQQKSEIEIQQAHLNTLLEQKKALSEDYEVQLAKARQEAATYKAKIKEDEKKIAKLKEEERKKLAALNASKGNSNKNTATIITNATGSELGKQIANYACQYIGNPYVLGGTSLTNGTDCSGFTYRVYADFGYSIPRTSFSQRSAGVSVDYANAQPGDIICYEGHVGMYIGGGQIVHASTPKSGIKVSSATYRTILGVRRIIQ
ncbi:MAG: C40 family peptidase [Bacteroidaceae bacterium]|nr:C40 family peptidase [Bacteroidaceae bacterium]